MNKFREELTAIPESRVRFLCLLHGGGETADTVPAARRERFDAHVEYNVAYASRWYERACRAYGSVTGEVEDIPKVRQAEAILYMRRKAAIHEARCTYELELERIARREAAASEFG